MMNIQFSLILATLTLLSAENSPDIFCYLDPSCDPSSSLWPGPCQNGKRQSPIDLPHDIRTNRSTKSTPRELNFNSKYLSTGFYIQDNGHSVQVSLSPGLTSEGRLTGYGFERPYVLAQIHFHWGENNSIGSEHTLNGDHYPMEVHMVHYDTKYPSFREAANANDSKSLAVLAIFLAPGIESDVNQAFDIIAANLPIQFQEIPTRVQGTLDLSSFLPTAGDTFYRYLGSLTTPNCTEDVIWTVMTKPIYVKPSEVDKFRTVRNHENAILGENFRPTRPINERLLEFGHKLGGESFENKSMKLVLGYFNLLLSLAFIFLNKL